MKLVTKSTVFAIAIFSTSMSQVGSAGAEGFWNLAALTL